MKNHLTKLMQLLKKEHLLIKSRSLRHSRKGTGLRMHQLTQI